MHAIIITIISFLLEGIFSFYIPIFSYFWLPIPTLLSVCFCHVYFLKNKNYIWYAFLTGILYDIAYTNTLFLHGVLFVCMGYIGKKISQFISHTWYQFLIMTILLIGIYRLLSYIILIIIGYLHFNPSFFLSITLASFLWNIIYSLLLYVLDHFILKKFTTKRLF